MGWALILDQERGRKERAAESSGLVESLGENVALCSVQIWYPATGVTPLAPRGRTREQVGRTA